jgi:oligosaccharide repeat unit polymerase
MFLTLFAIFYLTVLYVLLLVYQKSYFSVGNFLVGLYLLCTLASLYLFDEKYNYSLSATSYFLIVLTFFLLPAISFNQKMVKEITLVNENIFLFISRIFIILGLLSYLYFIPTIISFFSLGLSIKGLRSNVVGGLVFYQNDNFLYYVLTLFCQFFPIVIAFYFYSIACLKRSRLFNSLLLFSSTAYIVNVLAALGRSGLVYWPLMFLFVFTLFRRHLSAERQERTTKLIKGIGLGLFIPMMIISISRFTSEDGESNFFGSFFLYFGEQFANFNLFFNLFEPEGNASKFFPILNPNREILSPIEEASLSLLYYGVDGNVFSTFIGDFLKVFSGVGVFIGGLLYGVLGSFFLSAKKTISFGRLIMLIVVCQIPITGIFFYDYAHVVSNLYMILSVFLSLLFSYRIILNKQSDSSQSI